MLRVLWRDLHVGQSVKKAHSNVPWPAAHLAVLYVFLDGATAGIYCDSHRLTAVRTDDICCGLRCAISQGEIRVEVCIVVLSVVLHERQLKVLRLPLREELLEPIEALVPPAGVTVARLQRIEP